MIRIVGVIISVFLLNNTLVYSQNTDYLKKKEAYIPYPGSVNDYVKTIHIAIHVWQRADGSGNLKDNSHTKYRMDRIVNWMNDLMKKNYEAAIPALSYATDTIYDSRIRFQLEGIYYYRDASRDSSYFYSTKYLHNTKLNDYLAKNFPERAKTLNLHLFRGSYGGAAGYSEGGSVATFYRTNPEMDEHTTHDFWLAKHWVHEIGHGLDLWHTYNVNPIYRQNCKTQYEDFLWDVFDTTAVSKDKGCDLPLHVGKKNNNIMGGGEANFISNLQMGIMHRSMVLENVYNKGYNVRDFVTGYSHWGRVVSKDEHWDVSMKIYQDIIIRNGATLKITSEIQMVPQAKIIIEKGGTLLVDGGKITNERYYQKDWKGIRIQKVKKNPSESGKLILLNDGQVLHGKVK